MSGTSRILSASTVSAPIPGQPNTVSMMMTPVMMLMVSSPIVVTMGMDAFLSAWIEAIFDTGIPRPRAAVTYGFASSSSIELRAIWVMRPIGRRERASAGRMTWAAVPKPGGRQPVRVGPRRGGSG